jgi:hypothetical protein
MAYFMPQHRNTLRYGSLLAEGIVRKELDWNVAGVYDILTLAESIAQKAKDGVFAQLMIVKPVKATVPPHYRVFLHDAEILSFVERNPQVDMLSFITFIMTHELVHIHRFTTGKADFYGAPGEEEVLVDILTRLFLAKNPVTGLQKVLAVLDNMEAAPLYNEHIVNNQGRFICAYL